MHVMKKYSAKPQTICTYFLKISIVADTYAREIPASRILKRYLIVVFSLGLGEFINLCRSRRLKATVHGFD